MASRRDNFHRAKARSPSSPMGRPKKAVKNESRTDAGKPEENARWSSLHKIQEQDADVMDLHRCGGVQIPDPGNESLLEWRPSRQKNGDEST